MHRTVACLPRGALVVERLRDPRHVDRVVWARDAGGLLVEDRREFRRFEAGLGHVVGVGCGCRAPARGRERPSASGTRPTPPPPRSAGGGVGTDRAPTARRGAWRSGRAGPRCAPASAPDAACRDAAVWLG